MSLLTQMKFKIEVIFIDMIVKKSNQQQLLVIRLALYVHINENIASDNRKFRS